MAFAIKVEITDPRAKAFAFAAQKTMYGGKLIAAGDIIFLFASENEGGQGLDCVLLGFRYFGADGLRFGRWMALTLPLLAPPQNNRSPPSDSIPDT